MLIRKGCLHHGQPQLTERFLGEWGLLGWCDRDPVCLVVDEYADALISVGYFDYNGIRIHADGIIKRG